MYAAKFKYYLLGFSFMKYYALLIILVILISGCGTKTVNTTTTTIGAENMKQTVTLETSMGNIVIELADDMPITAGNFKKLASEGFYNKVIFHRVIDKFMIQGGDPTGTGRGGPGYAIPDEFTSHNQNNRGTIAMANSGPNTGGSQFFINLVNNNFLDQKHPVFGKVIKGMDVVDEIAQVTKDKNDKPLKNVTIIRVVVS